MKGKSGRPSQRTTQTWPGGSWSAGQATSWTTWSGNGEPDTLPHSSRPACNPPPHPVRSTLVHRMVGILEQRHPPASAAGCLMQVLSPRYPSFLDAVRDIDDPLTLVHLFATLPAEKRLHMPPKAIHDARRLALEWQAYVVRTHALRKVFVSIKGFYYQAEVLGQSVTWLVPHQLAQVSAK